MWTIRAHIVSALPLSSHIRLKIRPTDLTSANVDRSPNSLGMLLICRPMFWVVPEGTAAAVGDWGLAAGRLVFCSWPVLPPQQQRASFCSFPRESGQTLKFIWTRLASLSGFELPVLPSVYGRKGNPLSSLPLCSRCIWELHPSSCALAWLSNIPLIVAMSLTGWMSKSNDWNLY